MTPPLHKEASLLTEPVTLVVARTLTPGHESDYHAWVQRVVATCEHLPGSQSITFLAPREGRLLNEPSSTHRQVRFLVAKCARDEAPNSQGFSKV